MALINKVMPGYSATLWMQDDVTPTPLTDAQLGTWTAQVADIIGTAAGGTGTAGMAVPVEAIPAFGADDAFAAYSASPFVPIRPPHTFSKNRSCSSLFVPVRHHSSDEWLVNPDNCVPKTDAPIETAFSRH